MSFAHFATAMMREPPRDRAIWRMVAWLGKYGRQPGWWVMRLTISEALMLEEEVAQLMRDEKDAMEE